MDHCLFICFASLFVHAGFGHGCVSLSDEVALSILSDNRFSHAHGVGIRWDDPAIGINWGIDQPSLSAKDAVAPRLAEVNNLPIFGQI